MSHLDQRQEVDESGNWSRRDGWGVIAFAVVFTVVVLAAAVLAITANELD